jgi:hypothetical protein
MKDYGITTWMVFAMIAGCGVADDPVTRTDLAPNELGIVAIETQHFVEAGDEVFELRGLDAAASQIALARVRTGAIADLPVGVNGDTEGSELVLDAGGVQTRMISRALHEIVRANLPAELQSFVALDTVAATLDREAKIQFLVPEPTATDVAYTAGTACIASKLYSSPTAYQCCVGQFLPEYAFVNANTIVLRVAGEPCLGSGGGSCSGSACAFGPLGFAAPTLITGTGYAYTAPVFVDPPFNFTDCTGGFSSTPITDPWYGNQTGTIAKLVTDSKGNYVSGASCCETGAGPCGYGSYPACLSSSCVGSASHVTVAKTSAHYQY